jgi:hypothetical protein
VQAGARVSGAQIASGVKVVDNGASILFQALTASTN